MTKTLSKKAEKNGLHATRNDLSSRTRAQVAALLNASLADTIDLTYQVRQAHWNVKGPQFMQLHLLFDEMFAELSEFSDELAERCVALGGQALGTIKVAAKTSSLSEYPLDISSGSDHLEALADRYAQYAASSRANIERSDELGDADAADLYTAISRAVDKRLWFLEAHLES